ncbi:MAG: FtsX-like permease family protein [Bacteroidales bacterium]|nr:FtsX-like permease family protein [Bacteroidales bacterium]
MRSQTPFFIARRYLLSRKQKSVINRISWISLGGIVVSAMALIIVLSVYNGIGNLTKSLFNIFDPELLIQPEQGKTFHTEDIDYQAIVQSPGVEKVIPMVEENAWVTHQQNSAIVQLRGVDSAQFLDYAAQLGLQVALCPDEDGQPSSLLMGSEIAYQLGLRSIETYPIAVHIPKRGTSLGFTMEEAFNSGYAFNVGTFHIQQDIDARYMVADIDFVRSLMNYAPDECTALAVSVNGGCLEKVKQQLRTLLGPGFTVKDRMDQQPLYYKIFKSERLGVIMIMTLIILISTLSLVSSLSLLIIDKRRDVATLMSMGMTQHDVRMTFFLQGVLIAAIGVVTGLLLGFMVCLLQQQFGIIKMGNGNFVAESFPVAMRVIDFVATFLLVGLLSCGAVWITVRRKA